MIEIRDEHQKYFVPHYKGHTDTIRRIVRKFNYLPYKCALCLNEGFHNGKPLDLMLDHIHGRKPEIDWEGTDNRIENLRWLCPDCHSQQTTSHVNNGKSSEQFNINKAMEIYPTVGYSARKTLEAMGCNQRNSSLSSKIIGEARSRGMFVHEPLYGLVTDSEARRLVLVSKKIKKNVVEKFNLFFE